MKISDPRKNIIVASIGVLLVALTLVSCEKREDYYGRGDNGYSETIGFRVVDPMTQTRNHRGLAKVDNEAIDYKTVLRSDNSSDSLHLTTYVGDMNSQQYLMTRASAFTTTNLANFVVYGYNSKSEPFSFSDNFIAGSEAIKQTNGTWRFSPDVVWPSGKSDFFAVANIDNNTGVTISTANNVTPSLTYVVPEFATPLDDQGTSFRYNHKDVVVARSGIQEANTGLVPLNFQHVFTAVQFKFGEIKKAGQIHSISIEGIHLNGSLDLAYESASGFMAMNAWSYNDNGLATFSLPLGNNMNISETNNNGSIGTLENGFALMMIPQTLEGAKLKIKYTPAGSNTEVEMKANLIGTWAAGKVVTYTISISEILDIWFNNTTEICLDAHYVMSEVLDIHIGEDVGEWTLTSDADWLKFQTKDWNEVKTYNLHDLQEYGWWIGEFFYGGTVNSTNISAIAKKTIKLSLNDIDRKIVLVATENTEDTDRKATVTLSAGSGNSLISKTFTITQMCPHWNGNIGSERIEEYPIGFESGIPWGPYWKYEGNKATPEYKVTYDAKVMSGLNEVIAGLWQLLIGDGNVQENWGWDGWLYKITSYTFDFSSVVSATVNGTNSSTDGLSNTTGGYSTIQQQMSQFEKFLIGAGSTASSPTFSSIDPSQSAMLSVLKKNLIPLGLENNLGQTVYFADVNSATINWYLPAVNEAASGVYQENADAHACETSFLDKNENGEVVDGKVYWTSTSIDVEHAYTYQYGSTTTDASSQKDVTYHVRAIRRKTN